MLSNIERPTAPPARLQKVFADLTTTILANGLIGFIFAATGPFAVILSVGTRGGLTSAELASWVFGVFVVNGLLSLVMSWRYQMPLAFGWTIPGTVLVGPALQHLPFSAVIGAFYATSLLILLLGLSGFVKRLMSALPMPIVMGMVAGVFLVLRNPSARAAYAAGHCRLVSGCPNDRNTRPPQSWGLKCARVGSPHHTNTKLVVGGDVRACHSFNHHGFSRTKWPRCRGA